MKKILLFAALLFVSEISHSQDLLKEADSLKSIGFLKPALDKYTRSMKKHPLRETAYCIASTAALLWTPAMRDTAFYYLGYAIEFDQNLAALTDPSFFSLHSDPRWKKIENLQVSRYQRNHPKINNPDFAKELLRIIIKEHGFTYAREMRSYAASSNTGLMIPPSIFALLALEEQKLKENNIEKFKSLLIKYAWPTAAEVSQLASSLARELILQGTDELILECFPYVSAAFHKEKVDAALYAQAKDRYLIAKGKKQYYGTQIQHTYTESIPFPIKNADKVDNRRKRIGLDPLKSYYTSNY